MLKKTVAILLGLLLFCGIATASAGTGADQLKVIYSNGSVTSGTEDVKNGPIPSQNLTFLNTSSGIFQPLQIPQLQKSRPNPLIPKEREVVW